ncbi:hypothetical protein Ndes2437B_g06213 [Nannochloris sp. 'desiccata']
MMFSGFPFDPVMPLAMTQFAQDPWATCAPSMGCRYQFGANPGYISSPARAPPVVRRSVPRPQQLDPSQRVRIIRDQREVAVLIELPGFSRDELSIQVKDQSLEVSASTAPSFYYRFGATFAQSFRLGENIDTDAINARFQGGVLTLRLPYKAPKSNAARRVLIEGPSSPPRQLAAGWTPISPPTSPSAASKKAAQTAAPAQPAAPDAVPQQEERVLDVQEPPNKLQEEENLKQPTLPAKEHMNGELPAFEPVLQFVGEPSEKKNINTHRNNAKTMTAEEKAAAWVAGLEDADDADAEDGSIEDCEV